MILDRLTEFFDGTAIPGSAGTAALGDVIDLEVARDVGSGHALYWYVAVGDAAAGGTSVNLQLVSSDSDDLSNPTIHAQTGVIETADLTAGRNLVMVALPVEGNEYGRYLGIQAVTVGTFTDGTLSSGLTLDPRSWKAYPEGNN